MIREIYDDYWSETGYKPVNASLPGPIARHINENVQSGFDVIDVGAGDGSKVFESVRACQANYIGVDISPSAIKLAQAAGRNVQLIEDASKLPFSSGTSEVAICLEVLEHVYNPLDAVRECHRILKTDGKLIISVPNVAYLRHRVQMAVGTFDPLGDDKSRSQPWRDPHIRFFTAKSLKGMLEEAGFTNVRVGGHEGSLLRGLLGKIPVVGAQFIAGDSSRLYRFLEMRFPSLLGRRLNVIARKP